MKNFKFEALWLLSEKDGRARHLSLSTEVNALIGSNHTGKSTSIRMLFHTFGCNTKSLGEEWDKQAATAVTFSIAKNRYTLFRQRGTFALFDENLSLLWATNSQTEFGKHFSSLADFVLPLGHQSGAHKNARPAFFFIPFYIDQDGSWGSTWQTFDSLTEFRDWQRPTVELALGIRSSLYWKRYAELTTKKSEIQALVLEGNALRSAKKQLAASSPQEAWLRNALAFRTEFRDLEVSAGSIATRQQAMKIALADAAASRDALRAQCLLIDEAIAEHDKDMQFLDGRRVGESIPCPTCGVEHENSFADQMNLVADGDELREVRTVLMKKLGTVSKEISKLKDELDEVSVQSNAQEALLNTSKNNVKLRSIIEQAGLHTAYAAFDAREKELDSQVGQMIREISELNVALSALFNEERAKEIRSYFNMTYTKFATELDVPPSLVNRKGEVKVKPQQGGSGGPRAVLAYYFAMAHTAAEFGTGLLPPLVIDSPNQKAQDEINRPKVTEFIFRNKPPNMQLIVGLEDAPADAVVSTYQAKRFDFTKKFSLLEAEQFKQVYEFMEPLARAASAASTTTT